MSSAARSYTVRWSKAICKEQNDYIGWPTIARKADGELLAVFSGDRETHVCPYGKNEMVRSRDGGETWSPPETINNSPLDDRDTGIVVLRSGTIVVSWFTGPTWEHLERHRKRYPDSMVDSWARHLSKVSEEDRRRWLGHWTRRSTDGGNTWEPAVPAIATAPHGPIQLLDGRLLFLGNAVERYQNLVAVESTDEGQSWQRIGTIPVPAKDAHALAKPMSEWPLTETHGVQLPDGKIVYLWRYQEDYRGSPNCYLHQCESTDGGRTWTEPRPTPMWGYPPHLIRLHNGDLLATYGHRRPPYGERACLSHDGGQTWDIAHEIVLRDDAPSGDLGYPASIELEPGELLTVYYQIDQPGEKTSLVATRWSVS